MVIQLLQVLELLQLLQPGNTAPTRTTASARTTATTRTTASTAKVVCKTRHAFALRLRIPMLIMILQCISSNDAKNLLIIWPHPYPPLAHTPPVATALQCFHSAAGQRSRLGSEYRSCRSENQNTSVILPRR